MVKTSSNHALARYRSERGLTRKAFAQEIGVTPVTLWRWENYKRTPRRHEVERIAAYTNLSPAEVAGFAETERSS